MKINILKIQLVAVVLALLSSMSCTKNFEEINTNPNYPQVAPVENVFANVVYSLTSGFGSSEMKYPASFVGHITKGRYTTVTNYGDVPTTVLWSTTYRTIMSNANFVIKEAEANGNKNMLGATMVIKAYALQMVVDAYGPAPYFEAGLGAEGLIHPSYDREEVIYTELMQMLDNANDLLVDDIDNGSLGDGDLLYGGDILKWKKFCNSLHLRMAIRISNIDAATAGAEIGTILGDPVTYPVFGSNADNAEFVYPGDEDWREPWTAHHSSIGDDWMAKPLVDTMLLFIDPRLAFYADTLADGTYSGLVVGEKADTIYSRINDRFVKNEGGSVYFMKFSELEFIKAEAARRSLYQTPAEAGALYESAIRASCGEYGISQSDIDNYLLVSGVAWDGNLQKIYIQKWISLFKQSWEAWAEMRRTDIPTLPIAAETTAEGHNRVPFRFSYPDREVKLNGNNIPGDVNEVNYYWGYQIWWDTRTGVQ